MTLNLSITTNITGYHESVDCTVINPDSWDDKAYLLEFACGFSTFARLIVLADNMQDALDEYADSEFARFTLVGADDFESMSEDEREDLAMLGNASEPHNINDGYFHAKEIDLSPMFGEIVTYMKAFAPWQEGDDEPEALEEDEWSEKITGFYDLARFFSTRNSVAPSAGPGFSVGIWYTDSEANQGTREYFEKGITREESYHLRGFDPQIEEWIYNEIAAR